MDRLTAGHTFLTSSIGQFGSYAVYFLTIFIGLKLLGNLRSRLNAVKIKNSVCLITGASQGIGASLAEELVSRGAKKVILIARTQEKLEAVAEKINAKNPERVAIFPTDCSDYDQVEKMAESVVKKFGVPDIIVNSAGAGRWQYLFEMSAKDVVGCLDAPFLAAAFITKAFLLHLINANKPVTIVNVQSPAAYVSWGGSTAYASGRWALRGLTNCTRADVAGTKILVQEIILGETKSEYFTNNPGSLERIPKIGKLAPAMTSKDAATGVINGIKSGKDIYCYPFLLDVMMDCAKWVPSLMSFLVIKTGWKITDSLKKK